MLHPEPVLFIHSFSAIQELEKAIRMNVVKRMVRASDAQAEQSTGKTKKSARSNQNSKSDSWEKFELQFGAELTKEIGSDTVEKRGNAELINSQLYLIDLHAQVDQ